MLTNVLFYTAFTVPCVPKSYARVHDHAPGMSGISFSPNYNFFQQKGRGVVQVWTACSSISLAALFLTLMMCNSTGQSETAERVRHEGVRGIQQEHLRPELGLPRLPWLGLIRAGISTLLNSVWWFYDESLDWGWGDFENAFFPLLSNQLFVGSKALQQDLQAGAACAEIAWCARAPRLGLAAEGHTPSSPGSCDLRVAPCRWPYSQGKEFLAHITEYTRSCLLCRIETFCF